MKKDRIQQAAEDVNYDWVDVLRSVEGIEKTDEPFFEMQNVMFAIKRLLNDLLTLDVILEYEYGEAYLKSESQEVKDLICKLFLKVEE